MSDPCPFCSFEKSDFRQSHHWQCAECGKNYSDWLRACRPGSGANDGSGRHNAQREALFVARKGIPAEAEPVKSAQSLFLLVLLLMLLLNFAVEGVFDWVFPISAVLIAHYAWVMHRTGYAIGKHSVYQRDQHPVMFRVHFWGALLFVCIAIYAWLE